MRSGVNLRTTDDGVLLPVRVVPRARRTEVDGIHDGAIRIRLKAPPVDGAANQELRKFLAKRLKLRRSDVEIVSGFTGRSKRLLLRGATPGAILDELLTD